MKDKISSDIKIMVRLLKSKIESLEAIFLVGGFGRDEGSIMVHEGNVHVINDYDLVVITSRSCKKNTIYELRRILEKELSIRQVDITVYNKKQLKNMAFTMYSYDLKYASKTIYGNEKILDLIPNMDKSKMPILEAIRPLLLFPVSLLQARPKSANLSNIDLFWSYQQISKSILGWSTAMLIEKGLYDPLYSKRFELFENTFKNQKSICNLVKKATSFKLQPVFNPIEKEKINEFWLEATNAHLEVAEAILCKSYSTNDKSLTAFSRAYKRSLRNIIKYIFSSLTGIDKKSIINIEIGQLFLCKSLVVEDKIQSKKFFKLAKREADYISELPTEVSIEELIDSFLINNPNSKNWHEKGNKLSY